MSHLYRSLAAALLLSSTLLVGAQPVAPAGSAASRPHPAKRPFPQLELADRKSSGQRAIDLLGKRLDEVAAWHGKSPDEFRSMLLRDRRLKLDQRGRLFVEDELEAPLPASAVPSAPSSLLNGDLMPLEQTFALHSRAGARRTIYLNFKGGVLAGTAWNGSASTITALPFDIDGVPYSFSTAELQRIQYIWQRVAEDYAPFDVDVTTEAPAAEVLTRNGSTDQVFGTTVLITSRNGVYSCSCGGVAYIGIFDETTDYYKPALVFYDALGAGNEKYVAEAISHEAGHNMGLGHDGYSGGGYYSGHGSGATGWAPIMGVGYYQALVQWSKGEYATADNVQDDYAVMATNGLPLRPDDHGDTLATASALSGVTSNGLTSFSAEGVIERPSDVDVFSFGSAAGTVVLSVSPAARSANLDLLIELRNASGALLASANPVDSLPASLSFAVPAAGTYYLSVQGVGKGDPLAGGYSDYGSVGQYAVSGSAPAAAGQPPLAALTATPSSGLAPLTVGLSASASTDSDGNIVAYQWNFGDGSAPSGGVAASHVYGSAGSYVAQLTVTDNTGLTSTKSVTISVSNATPVQTARVADIALRLAAINSRSVRALADVSVRGADGRPLAGATVNGRWSGLVSGNVSAVSNANGVASLQSPGSRNPGTFIFTVTGVTLAGYSYDAASNTETSDAINR
jgi:PKD repeat protein